MSEAETAEGRQTDEEWGSGRNGDECDNNGAWSISRWLVSDPQREPWTKQQDNCGRSQREGDPESGRSGDSSETKRKGHTCQECPPAPWCSRQDQSHQACESNNDNTCENHKRGCLVEWLRINCKYTCTGDGCGERQNPDYERTCDHDVPSGWCLLRGSGIDAARDAVETDERPVPVNGRFEG